MDFSAIKARQKQVQAERLRALIEFQKNEYFENISIR
jgi:hypothetical protein